MSGWFLLGAVYLVCMTVCYCVSVWARVQRMADDEPTGIHAVAGEHLATEEPRGIRFGFTSPGAED